MEENDETIARSHGILEILRLEGGTAVAQQTKPSENATLQRPCQLLFFGHARKCVATALAASTRCCCVRWATEPLCPGRFSRRSPVKRRPKQIIAASAVDAGSNCAGNVLRWRVRAADTHGNSTTTTCQTQIVHP